MARGGAHFSSDELAKALSHYDLGVIHELEPLSAGNRRAPKEIVVSDRGKFLLKRRPRGKDDLYRVAFAHAVQLHLREKGFPATSLIATKDEDNTILKVDEHIYELFHFVSGARYDGSKQATIDAGRQMARFHSSLGDFDYEFLQPLKGGFHDSAKVRSHLKTVGSNKNTVGRGMGETADVLMGLYNSAAVRVNELGYDEWDSQIIHGDWHPGNMLFEESKVAAVLDFDSVKIAPVVMDVANGVLQFSIVGGRPNPADWPDYLDEERFVYFMDGYRQVRQLGEGELESLVELMIETIIAEAVLPVATTGFFGNMGGAEFLKMIRRKAEWIDSNRAELKKAMLA